MPRGHRTPQIAALGFYCFASYPNGGSQSIAPWQLGKNLPMRTQHQMPCTTANTEQKLPCSHWACLDRPPSIVCFLPANGDRQAEIVLAEKAAPGDGATAEDTPESKVQRVHRFAKSAIMQASGIVEKLGRTEQLRATRGLATATEIVQLYGALDLKSQRRGPDRYGVR